MLQKKEKNNENNEQIKNNNNVNNNQLNNTKIPLNNNDNNIINNNESYHTKNSLMKNQFKTSLSNSMSSNIQNEKIITQPINSEINEKNVNNNNNEFLNLSHLSTQMKYNFDYEINNIKIEENSNSKMFYTKNSTQKIINYSEFNDNLKNSPFEPPKNSFMASCLKRKVSKNKIRFQNKDFDLDMTYITDRIIAMGFPSTSCETLYRNSLSDISNYFKTYHKGNVKIYNLCLEKERIYPKNYFPNFKLALFPSLDHNPCPVKLLLEFCLDVMIFLMESLDGIAAVHCKAGKGRTGLMICCYLIFSGLCENSDFAMKYYDKMRTYDKKGVTIPSQIRYIKYFEAFLNTNYYKPFYYLIPKIIKEHVYINNILPDYNNLLINLSKDKRYYTSPNFFKLNYIKVGPLKTQTILDIKIEKFTKEIINKSNFYNSFKKNEKDEIFFVYKSQKNKRNNNNNFNINSDLKISFVKGLKFFICLNFWYSTLELFEKFLLNNEKNNKIIFEDNSNIELNNKKNKLKNGFLIFNETNSNNTKNINEILNNDDLYENKFKNSFISHKSDLNLIIDKINKIRNAKNLSLFDKNNISIYFKAKELDKFSDKKNYKNLYVKINYSIK